MPLIQAEQRKIFIARARGWLLIILSPVVAISVHLQTLIELSITGENCTFINVPLINRSQLDFCRGSKAQALNPHVMPSKSHHQKGQSF